MFHEIFLEFLIFILYTYVKCENVISLKNKAKEIETGNIRVCIKGMIYPRKKRKFKLVDPNLKQRL